MAYLYRHIRLDKNEPFYIGIGSDEEYEYKRAYQTRSRNRYWHNIVNSTDYEVEVMMDGLTWEEACLKEKEFVALYGRVCDGSGILANMTEGGDGVVGMSPSEETKEKLRKASNKPENMAAVMINLDKARIALERPVLQYDMQGIFIKEHPSAAKASQHVKTTGRGNITSCCLKLRHNAGGFIWRYNNENVVQSLPTSEVHRDPINSKKVLQYDLQGNFIQEWESMTKASKNIPKLCPGTIKRCCLGEASKAGGYKWEYKNN